MEFNLLVQVFLSIGLATIMFGIGLTLTGGEFIRILEMPRPVIVGLGGQLFGLPLAALATLALFHLPPEYAMGFLIIAVSPGGPTSNLFSFLAKADVALSVTLTAFSSTLTLITIPLILGAATQLVVGKHGQIDLPVTRILTQLVLLVLLPMAAGMLVRKYRSAWGQRWQRTTSALSVVILSCIIGYVLYQDFSRIMQYMDALYPSLVTFFLLALGVGVTSARITRLSWKQTKTISIEIGIQNGAQAMVIATGTLGFNNPQMGVPAALYSVNMYLFVFLLFLAFRVLDRLKR